MSVASRERSPGASHEALRLPEKTARELRMRSALTGWLFVAPALVAFGVFIAWPVVNMFLQSTQRDIGFGEQQFGGLHNFATMLSDPIVRQAFRTTLIFTLATTVLQTAVPLSLAILVFNGPVRSARIYRTWIFLPSAISLTVAGLVWRLGLTPIYGVVNRVLADIGLGGINQAWLSDPVTILPVIILVSVWQSTGLFMLIFYAGLGNVDPTILESARIDGAGKLREIWSITIPMLRPVIGVVVILNVIAGFQVFDLPFVMTGGGPDHASETMATYITLLIFGSGSGGEPEFGYGSAIGVIVFIATGIVSIVLWRLRRRPD